MNVYYFKTFLFSALSRLVSVPTKELLTDGNETKKV